MAPRICTSASPLRRPGAGIALLLGLLFNCQAYAIDVPAAEALMKDSGCNKCHAAAKAKDGPAYRDVAAKYVGKDDAVDKLIYHVTSGEKVKFDDGHEENHKKVKSKSDADTRNLVEWILSLPGGKAPAKATAQ